MFFAGESPVREKYKCIKKVCWNRDLCPNRERGSRAPGVQVSNSALRVQLLGPFSSLSFRAGSQCCFGWRSVGPSPTDAPKGNSAILTDTLSVTVTAKLGVSYLLLPLTLLCRTVLRALRCFAPHCAHSTLSSRRMRKGRLVDLGPFLGFG